MDGNPCGKKVQTYQDDEVKYVFNPTKHSYNSNLKNILLWTSFGEEEKAQANIAGLVGLFEVAWKTFCHNILVEFLNNQKLDFEHNRIKVMLGEEQKIIDKHVLAEVLKFCHIEKTEVDQAEMSDARVALADIVDIVLNTYNTNEGWVVKKMKSEYSNRIVAILPIIYQKDKVQYFSNKFAIMISRANHGKSINWAIIMFSQLVKEMVKWEKCQRNMIEGTTKRELKKDVCHFAIMLKVIFQK